MFGHDLGLLYVMVILHKTFSTLMVQRHKILIVALVLGGQCNSEQQM